MPRLRDQYVNDVVPRLMEEFGYKNVMQVPRIEKIVVNVGVGEAVQNVRALDAVSEQLAAITGQKPAIRRARKSIASFSLRAGAPVELMSRCVGGGCMIFLIGS